MEKTRQHVIEEILMTERSYVVDLELIVKVFVLPLLQNGILSPHEQQQRFANIHSILLLNKDLLRKVRRCFLWDDLFS